MINNTEPDTYRPCALPPPGWYCSRKENHGGPCATHRDVCVPLDTLRTKLGAEGSIVLSANHARLLYNLVKNMTVPKETLAIIELLELASRGE
jgi:hypothetical protein